MTDNIRVSAAEQNGDPTEYEGPDYTGCKENMASICVWQGCRGPVLGQFRVTNCGSAVERPGIV